jgi:hypothetical protein
MTCAGSNLWSCGTSTYDYLAFIVAGSIRIMRAARVTRIMRVARVISSLLDWGHFCQGVSQSFSTWDPRLGLLGSLELPGLLGSLELPGLLGLLELPGLFD